MNNCSPCDSKLPCSSYPDAKCVPYTGVNLPCLGVKTNERLDSILIKIDEKLCSVTPPPPPFQDGIVSGGIVTWLQDYDYNISPAVYYIGGERYESPSTNVTLEPADPVLDRIDLFQLTIDSTATVLTGIPSANPEAPDIDVNYAVQASFALIPAGSTAPTIPQEFIYLENTEWTTSSSTVRIDPDSLVSPYAGSKDIAGTATVNGDYIDFTAPVAPNMSTYNALTIKLRSRNPTGWGNTRKLVFQWFTGVTATGSAVTVGQNSYGFISTLTGVYQNITIPLSDFGNVNGIDKLRIRVNNTSGGNSWYLDNIMLALVDFPDTISNITLTGDVLGTGYPIIPTNLSLTGVIPGTYTNATITVDAKGRLSFADNGSGTSERFGVAGEDDVAGETRYFNLPTQNFDIDAGNPDYSGYIGNLSIVPGTAQIYSQGSDGGQSAKVSVSSPFDVPTVTFQSTVGGGSGDQMHVKITNDNFTVQRNGGTPRDVVRSINGTNFADADGNVTLSLAPTWQETLIAGSTLTQHNTIAGGNTNFFWNSMKHYINATADVDDTQNYKLNIGIATDQGAIKVTNTRIPSSILSIYDNSTAGSGANGATNIVLTSETGANLFRFTGRQAELHYGASYAVVLQDGGIYMGNSSSANGSFIGNRSILFAGGSYLWQNAATTQTSGSTIMNLSTTGDLALSGSASPASSKFTVDSTTKGMLPPRMTTTERDAIASPAVGLLLYNTTTNKLNVYTGTWEAITSA